MNKTIKNLVFTVPLSFEAHVIAEQCRQGITNLEKSKQVYLNSLAVYAVKYYLQQMDFATDWETSDSLNLIALKIADLADLIVKNIGKLECRPVLPNMESFKIPPEAWQDRIAYVAVQLSSSLKEATILGYLQTPAATVYLSQLESLEDFLLYLSTLEVEAETEKIVTSSSMTKLSHWLEGIVEKSWQKVDELFSSPQLGFAFMDEVNMIRGRKIDLGMQIDRLSVALVVKIASSNANLEEADILMQVRPITELALPEGVILQIYDDAGETVLETTSRKGDNWIQLAFSAEYGEDFRVAIAYQDGQVIETFTV